MPTAIDLRAFARADLVVAEAAQREVLDDGRASRPGRKLVRHASDVFLSPVRVLDEALGGELVRRAMIDGELRLWFRLWRCRCCAADAAERRQAVKTALARTKAGGAEHLWRLEALREQFA